MNEKFICVFVSAASSGLDAGQLQASIGAHVASINAETTAAGAGDFPRVKQEKLADDFIKEIDATQKDHDNNNPE